MIYDKPGNIISTAYGMDSVLSHAYATDGTEIFSAVPVLPDEIVATVIESDLLTNGLACEGGCYANGIWYMVTIKQDESEQYLYSYDLTTGIFTLRGTYSTLGHANSLAFNSNTGEILVATGTYENGIACISAETYQISRYLMTGRRQERSEGFWSVCYNRNDGLMYSWSGSDHQIDAYDTNGNHVKTIPISGYITHEIGQGMTTDGFYFYFVWALPNYIDAYTMTGELVKSIPLSVAGYATIELEEIDYDWDGHFYGQQYINRNSGHQRLIGVPLRAT